MFKPRFRLLWFAFAVTALVALMTATPLDFELHHMHCECYPELAWAGFGGPNALTLLIAGATMAIFGGAGLSQPRLRVTWVGATLAFLTFMLFFSVQELDARPPIKQWVVDAVIYAGFGWVGLSLVGLLVAILWQRPRALAQGA